MRLVTFDAAGTLIAHRWDPAGIAQSAASSCGISVGETSARTAYDSVAQKYRAEQVMLERIGDRSAIDDMWRRQMAEWLSEVGEDSSNAPHVLNAFRERAFGPGSHVFALYEDALPAIDFCRARGWSVGVISNWDHTLHAVLERLGVADKFDFVIASLEFGFEKPDERIFREALRRGNADAEEALHIGDDYNDDFLGATRAGWAALLVDRNLPSAPELNRVNSLTGGVELFA